MTDRRRNLAILGLVVLLLAGAFAIIFTKPTKLGLDLRGGIALVYGGKPTPKVPEVTPQAIDDSIETIRKRTDALGVSEPEIQRSGANQISIGLPDVQNADRAVEQVGTTAQLQFYDWEENVLPQSRGPDTTTSWPRLVSSMDFVRTRLGCPPQAWWKLIWKIFKGSPSSLVCSRLVFGL